MGGDTPEATLLLKLSQQLVHDLAVGLPFQLRLLWIAGEFERAFRGRLELVLGRSRLGGIALAHGHHRRDDLMDLLFCVVNRAGHGLRRNPDNQHSDDHPQARAIRVSLPLSFQAMLAAFRPSCPLFCPQTRWAVSPQPAFPTWPQWASRRIFG